MTKNELKVAVARKSFVTKKIADEVIEVLFETISDTVASGEKVAVSGFGTFFTGRIKDKRTVLFGDEDRVSIVKAHNVFLFRASRKTRKKIW